MRDTVAINQFLQNTMLKKTLKKVDSVTAARWLDEAGLLRDRLDDPGSLLRDLLRKGLIEGAFQEPSKPHGNWLICRSLDLFSFFHKGSTYSRREIHDLFGGQRQGGISTPSRYPVIFLFSSDRGQEYGYSDGWLDDGFYHYTGEGQLGDMSFMRGNQAVRDHKENGKVLLLFETLLNN